MGNNKKLAVLISCTDHYHNRMYLFDEYLQEQGYRTQYLAADYHHVRKEPFVCDVPGAEQIHVRPYRKNLSVSRILSHRDFARGVYKYLEKLPQEPSLIVAEIPPNFLASYLARYKRRHPQVKLVMDLFDLWPETFPSGKAKKLLAPAFGVWASLRNRSLPQADRIITECDLYRQKLGLLEDPRAHTVYLAAKPYAEPDVAADLPDDRLNLCYLGSINNIIDIPAIGALVKALAVDKPVTVHVIGKGERAEEFVCVLKEAGAQVIYHGAVYDEQKKHEIIASCHFGLNIMKPSVCIGLTMKSVDYWSHGLPILNNIGGDTAQLVAQYAVGYNLTGEAIEKMIALSGKEMASYRKNVRHMFDAFFAKSVIDKKVEDVLKDIL